MGLFDRAKAALGLGPLASTGPGPPGEGKLAAKKAGRPPLKDLPKASSEASLDDALVARASGKHEEARAVLAAIDRGKGLRTVLRAAAALEAGDLPEVELLLPALRDTEPRWMLPAQLAASVAAPEVRGRLLEDARSSGAPAWVLAWVHAAADDPIEATRGMADLLFADAPLARTVAARECKLDGAVDAREAVERYTSFAHGRDVIRRFGVAPVLAVYERSRGRSS